MDGKLRQVEARGPSAAAARRNLQIRLQKRQTPRNSLIASTDKISQLADLYLLELDRSDKAARTKDKYAYSVKKYITPRLGSIRIGEATSGVIDYFIRDVVDSAGPATARTCGAVLSWMFKIARRHDAVTVNPALGITIPRTRPAKPQALTPEQFQDLRSKLIAWENEPALGRNRTQELHQVADFLIFTGLRAGELFALRWEDVELDATPPTVFINATVIRVAAQGVQIQPRTKTAGSERIPALPPKLVTMIRDRIANGPRPGPAGVIFTSPAGLIRDPSNTQADLRKILDRAGYPWLTSHVFRGPWPPGWTTQGSASGTSRTSSGTPDPRPRSITTLAAAPSRQQTSPQHSAQLNDRTSKRVNGSFLVRLWFADRSANHGFR